MKIREELFLLFFIAVQVQCFNISKYISNNPCLISEIEVSFQETNSSKILTTNNLCVIYEHLKAINSLLKPKYEKLILVIADDVKDAVTMAKYLSHNNRVPIEKNKLFIPYLLLNDVRKILNLLYYDNETSTFIFAYPRNMGNEILGNYLAQKIINAAELSSVILTIKGEFENETLHRLFQVSSTILMEYPQILLIPLPDIPLNEHTCSIKFILEKIKNYLDDDNKNDENNDDYYYYYYHYNDVDNNVKESYNYLVKSIYNNLVNLNSQPKSETFLCKNGELFNSPEKVLHLLLGYSRIKLNNFFNLNSTEEDVNCMRLQMFKLKSKSLLTDSPFSKITTLSDVFDTLDFLVKQMSDLENEVSYMCNNNENLEIILQLCFLKFLPDKQLFESFESFAKNYFKQKIDWFQRLLAMFKNVNFWNATRKSSELEELYYGIPKINENDENSMKNALFTVKNITLKMNINVNCSPISSMNYKLQVKGNFLRLSDIGIALRKHICPGNVTFVELFSLDKIIIDKDLVLNGEGMSIYIFAPITEIILNRTIGTDSTSINSYDLPEDSRRTYFALSKKVINRKDLRLSSIVDKIDEVQLSFSKVRKNISNGISCFVEAGQGVAEGIHVRNELNSSSNYSKVDVQLLIDNDAVDKIDTSLNFQVYNKQCFKRSQIFVGMSKYIRLENFGDSFSEYRRFIVKEILKCICSTYDQLYYDLNSIKFIPHKYNTFIFIDELTEFEKHYSAKTNKTIMLNLLKMWNNKFREHLLYQLQSKNEILHTKVLLSLDTMVSRKIQKLENKVYPDALLIIKTLAVACIQDSEKLNDTKILFDMDIINERYTAEFDEEIKNLNALLSNQNYLFRRINNITTRIQELVKGIDKIIEVNKIENNRLLGLIGELKSQAVLLAILDFFKFVSLALSFINPVCAIVGASLSKDVNTFKSEPTDGSKYKAVITSMNRSYQHLREINENEEGRETFKPKNYENNYFDLVSIVEKVINKVREIKPKADELIDNINNSLEEIKNLKKYKIEMYEKLEPFAEEIHMKVINQSKKFRKLSIPYLDYEKWRMDAFLLDASKDFEEWTRKFNVDERVITKFKKAMETTIRLHTLMKEMNYKITGAQLISDRAKIPYQIDDIRDEKLENRVIQLTRIIYANDIIDENKKFSLIRNQLLFPSIGRMKVESIVDPLERANLIVNIYKPIWKFLRDANINKIYVPFYENSYWANLYSFYTWNNSTHSTEIQKILEGKTVKLFADIVLTLRML
ncbi:uncharacterized protein LOC122509575 [Leptopilina heterotoma]|uniref:uncharacterized protein LOC122509575 n=1 Tax=Leptopilina heterotoma TaxID=63436 RepID=UPI001CA92B07|nr:uncharacterized protein LOC122509575 [Leptopilina heterotoma]